MADSAGNRFYSISVSKLQSPEPRSPTQTRSSTRKVLKVPDLRGMVQEEEANAQRKREMERKQAALALRHSVRKASGNFPVEARRKPIRPIMSPSSQQV